MKFIINKQVLANANTTYIKELAPLFQLIGVPASELQGQDLCELKMANCSITSLGDEWVIEVSDSIMTKQANAVGRFLRVVVPMAVALKNAWCGLTDDFDSIATWLVKGE